MLGRPRLVLPARPRDPAGCLAGLARLAGRRPLSVSAARRADFQHVVVGGGVVGLAVARALAERAASSSSSASSSASVLLLERHAAVGTETSARNSEVVHAGLYYGAGSLKTRLCIRGRRLLYAFCAAHAVAHRRTGKWIVAQTAAQRAALDRIHATSQQLAFAGPDRLRWVGAAEAARREPAVRAAAGVLESPATGIVDSHALMLALQGLLEQAGGVVATHAPVVRIAPVPGAGTDGAAGWQLTVRAPPSAGGEETTVTAATLVNAAGLGAADVHNMITGGAADKTGPTEPTGPTGPAGKTPPGLRLYYAKGNYFSYAARQPRVGTLVYPAPEPGLAGLGTHLTLDLAGRMRFGPDVEWVDDPADLAVSAARLPSAVAAIQAYLPGIDPAALQPDYAGIRPKLQPPGATAPADFVVRAEPGYRGWINLLGIESPGLTSSLAIAEMVEGLLYGEHQ